MHDLTASSTDTRRFRIGRRERIVLALLTVVLWIAVRHQIARMDGRFFQPSLSGVKGLVLYMMGDYSGAADAYRAHFQEAYRTERTAADPGHDALLRGDLETAAQLSRNTLERDPTAIDPLLNLGEIALAKNANDEALHIFSRILNRVPDQYDALLLSSVAFTHSGDYGKAIDSLKLAFRTDTIESRITSFLLALKMTGELSQLPKQTKPLCLLAHLYRYLRIFDPSNGSIAVNYANQAIASRDRPDDAYITMGVVSYKERKKQQALREFLNAIEVNPRNPEAYHWAYVVYADRGDLPNEYRMIKAAYEIAPEDPFYVKGFTYVLIEKLGDYYEALMLAQKALETKPDDVRLLDRVGYVYHLLGDDERALEHFQKGLSLDPQNASLYERLGASLSTLGRHKEAITAIRRVLAIDPFRVHARLDLARAYHNEHRYPEAIAEYEAVARSGRIDAKYWGGLCALYHLTSEFQLAVKCYERVLAEDPRNTIARRNIQMSLKNLRMQKSSP